MAEIKITEQDGQITVEGGGSANDLLNLLSIAGATIIARSSLSTESPFDTMEQQLCAFDDVLTERSVSEIGRMSGMDPAAVEDLVNEYHQMVSELEAEMSQVEEPEAFEVPNCLTLNDEVGKILQFVERAKADTKANRREN